MTRDEQTRELAEIGERLGRLLADLAGERGHRGIMARAQVDAARDAVGKASGFLQSASSGLYSSVAKKDERE